MRFYIPPNLQRDFTDSLNALGTLATLNFSLTNKVLVRFDKVNYRTQNGVVSGDEVLFADLSSNLKMGDYLQYKEEVLLINQVKTNQFPSCYEISAGTCNTKFDITRYYEEECNNVGTITRVAGDHSVLKGLYCITTVSGFQFQTNNGAIGIIPDNTIVCQCQYNTTTKTFIEMDKFVWGNDTYHITGLDLSQIDLDGLDGILTFHAEKVA